MINYHQFNGEYTDVHLLPDSPCIDAGDSGPSCNDALLPPVLGSERCDMGAYGGAGNSEWLVTQEPVAVYD